MSDRGARRNLFDEIVRQRLCAEQMLTPVDPSLDPAVISERERREKDIEKNQKQAWAKDQDSWLASMTRLLPNSVRAQAQVALEQVTVAQVRERLTAGTDMAAWRKMQRQQIQGMRSLFKQQQSHLRQARSAVDNLISYVVRAPKLPERIAVAKRPSVPDLKILLETWRDPDQLRQFLNVNSQAAPGSSRAVDVARSVAVRRSQLLARLAQQRLAVSRLHRQENSRDSYDQRLERGHAIQEIARPVEKTKRNRAMPADLAAYHRCARNRAIRRSYKWWTNAHSLVGAHVFDIAPTAISFGAGATVIGSTGLDLISPATIHRDLLDIGPWAQHEGRKPFKNHLRHLIISLPEGFADRKDIAKHLMYRGHRFCARLGIDLSDHRCLLSLHQDSHCPHLHIIYSIIRESDGAVIKSDPMMDWRALNLESAIMTRDFQRGHGLRDQDSLIDAIGGYDGASRAATAALGESRATGEIVHPDGRREAYDILGKSASSRIMRCVGYQDRDDQLPGGIAKMVPIRQALTAPMGSFDGIIEYVLRAIAQI